MRHPVHTYSVHVNEGYSWHIFIFFFIFSWTSKSVSKRRQSFNKVSVFMSLEVRNEFTKGKYFLRPNAKKITLASSKQPRVRFMLYYYILRGARTRSRAPLHTKKKKRKYLVIFKRRYDLFLWSIFVTPDFIVTVAFCNKKILVLVIFHINYMMCK